MTLRRGRYMANSLNIQLYKHKTDITPRLWSGTWDELSELLTTHKARSKKDGPAWSPALLKADTKRANDNVTSLTVLALDVDNHDPEPVQAALKHMNLRAVMHSTFSHTAEHPCLRVVVALSRPLERAEAAEAWNALNARLGGVGDASTKDLARLYYLPSYPEEQADAAFAQKFDGEALDVDALLADATAANKKTQKFADSNGRINRRAIADDVLKTFNGDLWYWQGQIRCYADGWWQPLSDEELVSMVLTQYRGTVRDDADVVVRTLAGLCHHEPIQTEASERLICMANGTLDPVTMELHPHAADHRLTYALDFGWDPEAKAPLFDRFLHDIWGTETDFEERVRCISEFGGQIFLPSNRYGHFVWLLGQGSNGKSVLSRVFEMLAGKDNVSHAALERLSRASTRAQIAEKLLNVSSEIGADATLADGHLKAMVTGDAVDAEPKYKMPYTVYPRVKFLASTNHLPRLRDTSDGFKRRGIILTFPRAFSAEEQDPYLDDKLHAELPGIMVFCIQGLQRLIERGHVLPPPSSVEAMEEYRLESDPIRLFVQDCLEPAQGRGTATGDLFDRYKEWAQAGNYGVPNASRFGRVLSNLGYPVTVKSSGKPFRALQVRKDNPVKPLRPAPTPDEVEAMVAADIRDGKLVLPPRFGDRPLRKIANVETEFG